MKKIVVIGTRGIPDVLGGVETHCQELYPRLARLGCDITVVTRSPYVPAERRRSHWEGVELHHLFAPRRKSIEAIVHTFLAVLYARRVGADILHIHAIGPALLTPLARLLGLRTVLTHHGPDYDRGKWGRLARAVLRAGERAGARHADRIIVISRVIAQLLAEQHGRHDTVLIHNGVTLPEPSSRTDYLDSLGLQAGRYVIGVGRFVEEKGFHELLDAWQKTRRDDSQRLVLVGDADHETRYSRRLKEQARQAGAVLTGFIKGEPLAQIYSHARLFVMPSHHEGLPIALLEAMSYNLPVLVSDIPANREVPLAPADYFTTGDTADLARALSRKLNTPETPDHGRLLREHYDWDQVAQATLQVYSSLS